MVSRNNKIISVTAIAICLIVVTAVILLNYNLVPSTSPPLYQRQVLNRFPISLDKLFWMDNTTQRNIYLNGVKTGQTEIGFLFIVPYPNYFHNQHSPAAFKWYLYTHRPLPISFPVETYMNVFQDRGNKTVTINGTIIKIDLHVQFVVTSYISITFDHVCINQTLYNAWLATSPSILWGNYGRFVIIPANTTIGYTHNATALDFYISDTTVSNYGSTSDYNGIQHLANPFFYFTSTVQSQISAHYQIQYDAMKQSGLYVESRINMTYDINEPNSLFGTWFYHSGFFVLNSSHHQFGWYAFDGCILNMLNVNKTDSLTFYKDKNKGTNFNASMIGVYYDARYSSFSVPGVAGYIPIGGMYMYFKQGNYSQGIVAFNYFFGNIRPGPIFMKYQLIHNGPSMFDDILRVDYYSSLAAAQGSFTTNNLTYMRLYEHTS